MLARLLRLLLLFELFAYLAITIVLVKLSAWRPMGATLLMLAIAAGWRVWLTAVIYLLTLGQAAQKRDASSTAAKNMLRSLLREAGAATVLSIAYSFASRISRRDKCSDPRPGRIPLLLIHGYLSNRGFWWWLKPRIEARGFVVATMDLEPILGDLDGYAEQIARSVDVVCRRAGVEQLVLVGHGMGGLASRAYLRRYGEARVSRLITLGSPHRGNLLARFGPGRNARQMELGSSWLRELELAPLRVPCIAYWGTDDIQVIPVVGAQLLGADNRPLPGVGHLAMAVSPVVLEAVCESASAIIPEPQ